jgi:mono/diheme cytochrome c family protein
MRQTFANQLALAIGVLILVLAVLFALIQSTRPRGEPSDTALRVAGAIPHPIVGYESCTQCHGLEGTRPYPPDHQGWPDEFCAACHAPTSLAE